MSEKKSPANSANVVFEKLRFMEEAFKAIAEIETMNDRISDSKILDLTPSFYYGAFELLGHIAVEVNELANRLPSKTEEASEEVQS